MKTNNIILTDRELEYIYSNLDFVPPTQIYLKIEKKIRKRVMKYKDLDDALRGNNE